MENEYVEPASVRKVAFKWGLIFGLISVVLAMIWQFAGLAGENWTNWLGLIPLVITMYLSHKEFKDTGDSYMSYGQGLGTGTLMSLVAGVISSIFTYIYLAYVDDSIQKKSMDEAYESWETQG
ncbi:MAG: DUF4199 domain-containing protein [Bacteroidota bacterium]